MEAFVHIDRRDHVKYADDTLIIIGEKVIYAHDDFSIRPFIMIDTVGNPGDETKVESIHLVMLDLDGIKIRQ